MSLYQTITNGISSLIGLFSPRSAIAYSKAHAVLRGYDAGKAGGMDRNWIPGTKTGDLEIGGDWRKVIDKSRDLVRNNPMVADGMRKYVAFTVGTALWPQSRVRSSDGKALDKITCDKIEQAFSLWAEHCLVSGGDWDDGKKLVARHFKTDGEVLVLKASTDIHPLQLQIIESDQLDTTIDGDLKNGNAAVRGIEFNKFGRPVAYHILDTHPGDWLFSIKSVRIPAERVIHVFSPDRVTESRGICHFVSSIIPAYTHDQQKKAVMDLLRIAAAYGIFVESDFPEDYVYGLPTETQAAGSEGQTKAQPYQYVNPAGIHYMRRGEKINSVVPAQPTAAYKDFEQSHLRGEASGFGMSYETFTGDLTNANYSSLRQGQVNERAEFRQDTDLFIRKLCMPIFREWMDAEILAGGLRLPGYWSRRSEYQRVVFSRPGLPSPDPVKEEVADKQALENGTTTRRIIAERKGEDLDDILDQLEQEISAMKAKGIIVPDPKQPPAPPAQNAKGSTDAQVQE